MKLSIIVPVYNAEKYISACIDSIFSSKSKNCEFIFIDDGSTDNSKNIILGYQKKYKNIKYYYQQNGGVSSARNLGVEKATGRYVMFLDSDDLLMNTWYSSISKCFSSNYDIIIFSKNVPEIFNIVSIRKACLPYKSEYSSCRIMAPFSKMYLRNFLIENNIVFNTDIINGEDMLFNYQVLSSTSKIGVFGESIYNYRMNFSSSTSNYNNKINESNLCFLKEMKKLLGEKKINEYALLTLNGLVVIAKRISFSNEKNKTKILKNILDNEIYKSMFSHYDHIKINLSKYDMLILYLILHNYISLCMFILCMVRKLKKFKYKTKTEIKFVEI